MKFASALLTVGALLAGNAFAQAPAAATAPAAAAPASVHAVCKDGTPFEGATLRGACRGHGGVDKKASAGGAAPVAAAPAPAPAAAPAPAKAAPAKPAAAPMAAAPGGGAGQVWANDSTKVYHCQGDRFYGKTKKGEYLSEADAKAKGFHAARGKACAA